MTFYEDFSRVYDEIMDQSLYEKWLAFSVRHFPRKAKRILELACGSGALAVKFAQAGFQVTGLDLSPEMLKLAQKKAKAAGQKIQFVAHDMRELQDLSEFDAVTCYSDSLCYLADLSELQEVFHQVHQHLSANGVFIFDVHSIYQMEKVFPDYAYHENEEDYAFLWDSYKGELPHSIEHQLSFFLKDEDGKFIRKDELHDERTYPIKDYLSALAGFSEVQVFADFADKAPIETSQRWFFVCQK